MSTVSSDSLRRFCTNLPWGPPLSLRTRSFTESAKRQGANIGEALLGTNRLGCDDCEWLHSDGENLSDSSRGRAIFAWPKWVFFTPLYWSYEG